MEQAIFPHFSTFFEEVRTSVFEEFDIEEEDLEDATEFYMPSNGNISKYTGKIKTVYHHYGGDVDIPGEKTSGSGGGVAAGGGSGNRGEFSLQDCLDILDVLSEKMSKIAEEYIQAFVNKFGVPQTPV